MNRQEFLIEATLRLVSSRQQGEAMTELVEKAQILTSAVFGEEVRVLCGDTDDDKIVAEDMLYHISISDLLDEVQKYDNEELEERIKMYGSSCRMQRCGYANRIAKVCKYEGVETIGDLKRIGRASFRQFSNIGENCVIKIDKALKNLYHIESW